MRSPASASLAAAAMAVSCLVAHEVRAVPPPTPLPVPPSTVHRVPAPATPFNRQAAKPFVEYTLDGHLRDTIGSSGPLKVDTTLSSRELAFGPGHDGKNPGSLASVDGSTAVLVYPGATWFARPAFTLAFWTWVDGKPDCLGRPVCSCAKMFVHAGTFWIGTESSCTVDKLGGPWTLDFMYTSTDNKPHATYAYPQVMGPPIEARKWHEIVVSYDSTKPLVRVWLDGKAVGSSALPMVNGAHQVNLGPVKTGNIDDFRVYDGALTPTDLAPAAPAALIR